MNYSPAKNLQWWIGSDLGAESRRHVATLLHAHICP